MPEQNRQKFLLHTCCAPCGIAVIDELRQNYDLTVYFYNPNIYPLEEYKKRKAEVIKLCKEWKINMVDDDYENEKWFAAIKGLEQEPEGGARCSQCFILRLGEAAKKAKDLGCKYFSTTLTMGRFKKAEVINPIGKIAACEYGLEFFDEDWKKKGRQEKRDKMVKERGIYLQKYCGCMFSLKNMELREKNKSIN